MTKQPTVNDFMRYEDGGMSEDEQVAFMQVLIDTGMAWGLQGSYGRTAEQMIQAGLCDRPAMPLVRKEEQKHMFSKTKIDYDHIASSAGSWTTHDAFMPGSCSDDPELGTLVSSLFALDNFVSETSARAQECFRRACSLIWARVQEDAEFSAAAEEFEAAARARNRAWAAGDAAELLVAGTRGRNRIAQQAKVQELHGATYDASLRVKSAQERLEKRVEAHIPRGMGFDGTERLNRVLKMHLQKVMAQTLNADCEE